MDVGFPSTILAFGWVPAWEGRFSGGILKAQSNRDQQMISEYAVLSVQTLKVPGRATSTVYRQLFDRVADCNPGGPERIEIPAKIGGSVPRFRLGLTRPTWPRTETEQKFPTRRTTSGQHSPSLHLRSSPHLPACWVLGIQPAVT